MNVTMPAPGLSTAPSPTLIRPQRSLGGLTFDIVVEESHEDSLTITEHPVESGASVSDHAVEKPRRVTIRGAVSDVGTATDGNDRRSTSFYEQVRTLQSSKEPFEIVTGRRTYSNMLLETVSVVDDAASDGSAVISCECREVIIVSTKTTTMAPRSRQANGAKTAGTTDTGNKQPVKRSAMAEAGGGGVRRPGGPADLGAL